MFYVKCEKRKKYEYSVPSFKCYLNQYHIAFLHFLK